MALRMGVQLDVFTTINSHEVAGTTTQEIAEKAGASPIVVGMPFLPSFTQYGLTVSLLRPSLESSLCRKLRS